MAERNDTPAAAAPDLGSALSMAAEIFQSGRSAPVSSPEAPAAAQSAPQQEPLPSNEELAARLSALLQHKSEPKAEAPLPAVLPAPADAEHDGSSGPGLGAIAALLPTLMQAFSGSGDFIKPEKLNLIRALKPYLSQGRSAGIDRAIRMANIAQAAKSALTALGK